MLRCLADLVCLSHTLVICVIHEMIGDKIKRGLYYVGLKELIQRHGRFNFL